MKSLYRLGTAAYHTALNLAARFGHEQARAWVNGRKAQRVPPKADGTKRFWMHCASLGEWEQGRSVMEACRAELSGEWEFVLSFFSPSGYTRSRAEGLADLVLYLPADEPAAAARWVAELEPDLAVFVKYEFWFYHLNALRNAGVPVWLVAASFRPDQLFFRSYGGWYRRVLQLFAGIITQDAASRELAIGAGAYPAEQIFVGGDPRIDRTLALAQQSFHDDKLAAFAEGHEVIICGSVWPEDMKAWGEVREQMPAGWRLVFAPHQLHEKELARTQEQWGGSRYTVSEPAELSEASVMILDTIGILSRAYRYGHLAYIGGAFRTGLHNTLEPMAYGLPTIFGPKHYKFPEAARAIRAGGAFSVSNAEELRQTIQYLAEAENYHQAQSAQNHLLQQNAGAAQRTARLMLNQLTQPTT